MSNVVARSVFLVVLTFLLFQLYSCAGGEQAEQPQYLIGMREGAPVLSQTPSQQRIWVSVQSDKEAVAKLADKNLSFALLPLAAAARHYLDGTAIVAIAGCEDSGKRIWLLTTHPDLIRENSDAVRQSVRTFYQESAPTCRPIALSEIEMYAKRERIVQDFQKVNLSWFIDLSFQPKER